MPAFMMHRGLELYAQAGIPNLLLLDGNPLEDISAVRRGVLVMKGDALYRPDELYQAVGVKPFLESSNW